MTREQVRAKVAEAYALNPLAILVVTVQLIEIVRRPTKRQGDAEALRDRYVDLVCALLGVP